MKIKKNDIVFVAAGKDRGKKGKVLRVFPQAQKLLVEGLNLRKRHVKPKRAGEKGQIIEQPSPFAVSNARLVCASCGKPTRVGMKIIDQKKVRVCKKCGNSL